MQLYLRYLKHLMYHPLTQYLAYVIYYELMQKYYFGIELLLQELSEVNHYIVV